MSIEEDGFSGDRREINAEMLKIAKELGLQGKTKPNICRGGRGLPRRAQGGVTLIGIGLVGAGLQGKRRSQAVMNIPNTRLVTIADNDVTRARLLAEKTNCAATQDWHQVLKDPAIDLVLVCTPNSTHAEISIAAMNSGKHILCEKPLARSVEEAERMVHESRRNHVNLKCGFNLRYHPGIRRVLQWKKDGEIGHPMFIKCTYGICGREGYEKDWRMNREVSGGGQLMDQGLHVLDLCRLFVGEFSEVSGKVSTTYWKTSVEDNAFGLMKTKGGVVADFHASWTIWNNTFSFEMAGTDGTAIAQGLGGSYGTESAYLVKRPRFDEPFTETRVEFRGDDRSFELELSDLVNAIETGRVIDDGTDGLEALRLAQAIYQSAETGRSVMP